ncbi:MAG: hypothetical protein ACXQTG_01505 [Methanoculleaceae archaeon]
MGSAFPATGAILSARSLDGMSGYDQGVVTAELNNHTVMGMGGDVGFISYTLYYPAEDVSLLLLSTRDRTPMATRTLPAPGRRERAGDLFSGMTGHVYMPQSSGCGVFRVWVMPHPAPPSSRGPAHKVRIVMDRMSTH